MTGEELVNRIVEEVLRRLNRGQVPAPSLPGHCRILVVVTGGTIGARVALAELAHLKSQRGLGVEYFILFSRSAAAIHDPGKWRQELQAVDVLIEGESNRGRHTELLKLCDLVVVPVLTRTTAARLASMLLDSAAAEVVVDALMQGLPVIAASDAADPTSEGFARLGMNRGRLPLVQAMKENLEKVAAFGVILVPARELGGAVAEMTGRRVQIETASRSSRAKSLPESPYQLPAVFSAIPAVEKCSGRRMVITRTELAGLVSNNGVVRIPRGALVTPLAWDVIREAGWQVEEYDSLS
ncbi:hypothetical protein [Desulfofundulus thermocisternus]|uniref:hypothetical protein n=1 Tax=Desulfofundulus thermocisternus TaxID=42471 RepID=UPI0019FCC195|nr:hypothetical protein [Desulfofundulus thermocisternus]MBE3585861.1 hypothetical protein [Thermoanaerobacter sp.]MCS5696439.1 hypothetical protein [Desulfofundulus thermocisternus]